MSGDQENPTAPRPDRSELFSTSLAAREIRMVARTFRWTALAGLAFSAAMLVQSVPNIRLAQDANESTLWWAMVPTSLLFGAAFFALLVATKNLNTGHPSGRKQAILACHLMYFGLPLFTIVGWICKRKIIQHYDDYCELVGHFRRK